MNIPAPRNQRNRLRTMPPAVVFRVMLVCAGMLSLVSGSSADEIDVWIGTSGKDGIFHLTLDTEQGKMSAPVRAAQIEGAGFLAMHPNGKFLYATSKENGGSVASFSIGELKKFDQQDRNKNAGKDPSQNLLHLLNDQPTGDGGAACVGVDKTGRVLMSAQYGGGSVSTYTIKPDGSLDQRVEVVEHGDGSGAIPKRQAKSHPHWVGTSPDNRFLMVPDLGTDRVVVYELDAATAKLKPHSKIALPPGSGTRHMKFHTSGKYSYVLNELALTISVFAYDVESGGFKEIQLIETLPADQMDKHSHSAAEIRVHPTGKFVYSSNRGHDSISVFSVDQETGKLTLVEREHIRGSIPRNFNLDPSGMWLIAAGQSSNTLALFEIDQASGELIFTRKIVNVPAPICVLFGPM
jgi:6-phosphogluconolactonase